MPTNKMILIVGEEGVINSGIGETLENLGYNVVGEAKNGQEVTEMAKVLLPDLVLMDIALRGDMGWTEAAEQIYGLYDIPVICLLSPSDEVLLNGAFKRNGFGYLIKPFSERELYSNIEMTLHKHRIMKKAEPGDLESTLTFVSDAVITTDAGGNVTRINPAAESLTGWSREEASGLDFFTLFKLDKERIFGMMNSLRNDSLEKKNLLSWVDGLKLKKKSGEETYLSLNIGYVKGNRWDPDEFFFVLIPDEMMEQCVRESSLERYYRIVMDAIKNPVFLVDSRMKIVVYNQAFSDLCNILGINQSYTDKPVYDILPNAIFGGKTDYQDIFGTGVFYKKERMYKRLDETRIIDIETIPLFDKKKVTHLAVIIYDVTWERETDERDEKIAENFSAHSRNIEEIADLCALLKSPVGRIRNLAGGENSGKSKQISEAATEISDLLFEIDMKLLNYEKIKTYFDFCGVSLLDEKKGEEK